MQCILYFKLFTFYCKYALQSFHCKVCILHSFTACTLHKFAFTCSSFDFRLFLFCTWKPSGALRVLKKENVENGDLLRFLFLRPRFVFFLGTPEASERTEALWMLMSSKSEKSSKKSSSLCEEKKKRDVTQRRACRAYMKYLMTRSGSTSSSCTEEAFFLLLLCPAFSLGFLAFAFFFVSFGCLLFFLALGPVTWEAKTHLSWINKQQIKIWLSKFKENK